MKPFDLEKAKNGALVCLDDGTPVKILDFNYNGKILCKLQQKGLSGKIIDRLGDFDSDDLCMSPTFVYMNVYKKENNSELVGGSIRATQEECVDARKTDHLNDWLQWFCVAKVELLMEDE